ncbi:hypothetical protein SAMN04488069_1173 [Hymenobacter psychrophilus]|uniref:Uncharacterized protein n=2 Tax=Hymenobacter psychrophilus TaxID=651662 RepID=A0A1H3NGV3_9BACT|nr:hypothetical protein SAMN04488069_1173 [Hymenobacter psychrophilus]
MGAVSAAAQTAPAAPGLGLSHRMPGQAAPSYQHPTMQTQVYRVGPSPGATSYQTRPNALRVAVPDTTTDRRMPQLVLPAPAPDSRDIVPLPPQRRVRG